MMRPADRKMQASHPFESPIRILLVEDTAFVREAILETLVLEGHTVIEAASGREALAHFAKDAVDLILLDIVLPDMSGFEVCQTIRAQSDIPIVMLTALNHTDDILRGFELGADDYITKPFAPSELLGRISAIVRRLDWQDAKAGRAGFIFGDMALDEGLERATVAGQTVCLSPIEARLLRYLMEHPNRAISKEELFQEVWGYELAGGTNLVEAAVRRLRTKVEEMPSTPTRILTVHGLGYKLNNPVGEKDDNTGTEQAAS
jgi:DNA-binding response OmpR family regulator